MVALVVQNGQNDLGSLVVELSRDEVLCVCLLEVGVQLDVAGKDMAGSVWSLETHHPRAELLPDLFVLGERQIAERPVVDLSRPPHHVLLLQGLRVHQPQSRHARQLHQGLLEGSVQRGPLLRLQRP